MAAAIAATAIVLAVSVPSAIAETMETDSWDCEWVASSTSGVRSTTSKVFGSCVDQVGLVFSYYQNGSWTYGTWDWTTASLISESHAGTQAEGDHQVIVDGQYGQLVGTSYP